MRSKAIPTDSRISFFMDDGIRLCAIVDLDGTVIDTNEALKQRFGNINNLNLKLFMTQTTCEIWSDFLGRAQQSDMDQFEVLPVNTRVTAKEESRVHLMYCHDLRKIIAFFNMPKKFGMAPFKTYFNAFRDSKNFMVLVDTNGKICDVNNMHTSFFNKTREDFIGKDYELFLGLIPNFTPEIRDIYMRRLLMNGYADETVLYQMPNNDIKYYHITTYHDKETDMYVIQVIDYTEKEILEQQLAHSGSLSAVGQIAASIAHEIRNPMTTLKGFVQLLEVNASGDTLKYLSVIEGEIERMEAILNEMLILSKPMSNEKTTFSLEVLINDTIGIIQPKALMDGVCIVRKGEKVKNSLIDGNADKIKQVLLNLFKNALESMTSGGVLTIQLEQPDTSTILLFVTDTGKGMNRNELNQIFIPFFTSKSGGTGLGLPFVLKTIEEHGGTIIVESQEGIGTTFSLTFPSVETCVRETVPNEPFNAI